MKTTTSIERDGQVQLTLTSETNAEREALWHSMETGELRLFLAELTRRHENDGGCCTGIPRCRIGGER